MTLLASILVCLVALLHVYFLVLEMFLWTRPLGMKVFRNTPDKAQLTRVLAANQGLYNGFLAAGLGWGVVAQRADVMLFFLGCVVVAGLYGAWSVSRRILFVQALPAALAIAAVLLAY
ncbi:DUF1304 domain-containing protein [Xanthomonas sp. AM6]|uniref:DUF1304 domain-containing protein n=1 Tax=Xanthomonas sp. AM6 TaxID=2982531 RepID=UPI0021D91AF1|nr:DUF1304 domain-containing protein [Xanthomonas sp. AM6]UYB53500.1 DUF1304 domain-containing protein [Xanthomonas sp. AM6]